MWDGDTTARHSLKLLDPGMLEMAGCPAKLHQKVRLNVAQAGATSRGDGIASHTRTESDYKHEINMKQIQSLPFLPC